MISLKGDVIEAEFAMANNIIHDRGRGPEIVGTRITIYNLLPEFLDPSVTEASLCELYELTPEQVAAAGVCAQPCGHGLGPASGD